MNKRKEKKNEIDKAQVMVKTLIEQTLKNCNEKALPDLAPNFVFQPGDSLTTMKNFSQDIESYVSISNRYFHFKNSEEKAKFSVKRQKKDPSLQQTKQYDQLEYVAEVERIIGELIKDIPPHV
jgi:hypothetical protein